MLCSRPCVADIRLTAILPALELHEVLRTSRYGFCSWCVNGQHGRDLSTYHAARLSLLQSDSSVHTACIEYHFTQHLALLENAIQTKRRVINIVDTTPFSYLRNM
jgi:hypothetical protein